MTSLTEHDYRFLTGTWEDTRGAAYNVVGEDCFENGYIDIFGFVTPKGQKAIEAYKQERIDVV